MSKKAGKGVFKRLFSKDGDSEAGSSTGVPADKKKKKKGSMLRKGSTIRDSTPPDSAAAHDDRLSTILSEGQTHAPTVTRAPTVTDYQPYAFTPTDGEHERYFDEDSMRAASDINIHDHHHHDHHHHGGMTSPTVLGEPWHASPEHAHHPLHAPPSRNASVRQAPSAITRHGTVINDHGSFLHVPGGAAAMGGGGVRNTPSHVPLPASLDDHTLRTHRSMGSHRTHRSSAQHAHHDAPIYIHDPHHGGHEPIVVNAGAPPSASGHGNNYYVVDPSGHQRHVSIPRQPTLVTPINAGESVLQPGDTMEIDPTNPPLFMLDDGVELEIDNGNGFVPYNQFMEEFSRRPRPPPPSTFVVHGAGDVIIQDEEGVHIRTIPGRGAEAGRGQPQRYNVNGSTIIVL